MGWLQTQDTSLQPTWGSFDSDLFLPHTAIVESVQAKWTYYEDHPFWKVIQSQDSPWRHFWVSASALCCYYWQYQIVRHRRGQLVHAGWDVPEPPGMLVSHYIGLSFFETQPTGWSINTINCVALQRRLCWLTGAYRGAGGWQVMKLVSANQFICKL